MSEKTTNTSSDESRKELKIEKANDRKVQEAIKKWGEGKNIFVACINPEFAVEILNQAGGTNNSERIKVSSKAAMFLRDLANGKEVTDLKGKRFKLDDPKFQKALKKAAAEAKKRAEAAKEKIEKEAKQMEQEDNTK